jgi:hypothetical protein
VLQNKEGIHILFTGDLSLTGVFYLETEKGNDIFSNEISEVIENADFCVCNFEGPATKLETITNTGYTIVSPVNSIKFLTAKHINIFNLANNHIFDSGAGGFKEVIHEINNNGGLYFGAGENIKIASSPTYLKRNSVSVALIGIAECSEMISTNDTPGIFSEKNFRLLKQRVREAKENARWVIVNYHGGEEYTIIPSPAKKRMARKLSSISGVDIVICHHSHTFQSIEKDNGKTIFYSLGNFIFDFEPQHIYPHTDVSAIVSIIFSETDYKYSLIPTKINYSLKEIELGDMLFLEHVDNISNKSNYWRKWINESNRVLFNKVPVDLAVNSRLQDQSPLKWIFQKKFYQKVLTVLCHRYSRNIYFYGVLRKILKKGE